MVQTTYVNPNGLPADAQITSARDQAILARAIIRELPEYELYWRISAIKFGKRVMRNYNTLIDRYPGADGMKTGFICASGFNLVASATRNGKRLIAVVLGAPFRPGARGEGRADAGARIPEYRLHLARALARQCRRPRADQGRAAEPARRHVRQETQASGRRDAKTTMTTMHARSQVDSASPHSINLANLRGSISKPSTLIGALTPSMEPIVVFTGATKPGTECRGRRPRSRRPRRRKTRDATAAAKPPLLPRRSPPKRRSRSDRARFRGDAADLSVDERVHAGAGRQRRRPPLRRRRSRPTARPSRPTSPPTKSRRPSRPTGQARNQREAGRHPGLGRGQTGGEADRAVTDGAQRPRGPGTADPAHAPHRLSRRRQDHAPQHAARPTRR